MNPLPRYLFCKNEELGAGLVILNEPLPLCARIIQYKDNITMLQALNSRPPIAFSVVPGYSVALIYAGVIGRGFKLIGGPQALAEVQSKVEEMTRWYFEEFVQRFPHKHKRFKL
jgi:hypothetical protein